MNSSIVIAEKPTSYQFGRAWVALTIVLAAHVADEALTGHLGGSIYLGRWMPGATTAPFLLVASIYLLRAAFIARR